MGQACDYEQLLELVVGILEHPEPTQPWSTVLATIKKQLNGTGALVSEIVPSAGRSVIHAVTPQELGQLTAMLDPCIPGDPLIQHYLTTGDVQPHTTDEVVELATWQRTLGYSLAREAVGARSCVSIPLKAPEGGHRGVTVVLPELTLPERHRSYVRGIQQLLTALDCHLRHLERWHRQFRSVPSEDDTGHTDKAVQLGLTPREMTILALLSDTLTAAAVGRRLGISIRTVHKHLEHVYRKLGTNDRLETVLRARSLGLLPSEGVGHDTAADAPYPR